MLIKHSKHKPIYKYCKINVASVSVATKPAAYLNWILFDEQFHAVYTNDGKNSGFLQVGNDTTFTTHLVTGQVLTKSGWLYVYVSNETPNINVYFDNLQLTHMRGRIIEEDHYYPYGLTMAGISSQEAGKPENRFKYNGKELQHKEFSDGTGLEWYDYGARMQDPQLGRTNIIDPKSEINRRWSSYAYGADNPERFIDPDGMIWEDPKDAEKLKTRVINELNAQKLQLQLFQSKLDNKELKISDKDRKEIEHDLSETTERIAQLETSSNDIDKLGKDKNTYRFVTTNEYTDNVTKGDDGVINIIGSAKAEDAMHLHEIRHVAEALDSKEGLIFDDNNELHAANLAKLFVTEISAYKAQYSFSPNTVQNINSIGKINVRFLGAMVDENGTPVYKGVANYWNSLSSQEQNLYP